MVAGYDGLIKFSIGEIFEVSITTEDYIAKYGTNVSSEGENIELNKCEISRMITVATLTADGELSHWTLSLEDFFPFTSIPNCRVLNERT